MLPKYKTLLLDDTRLNEFDSYREEYYFLEELKKEEDSKEDDKKDTSKDKIKKVDKKATNAVIILGKAIKSLYSTGDDHLVDGTLELSKVITRTIVVIVGAASIATGTGFIAGLTTLLIGAIGHFTSLAVRRGNDAKRREKLMHMFKAKLEFVEDKIGRADDKEKEALIKIKHKLQSDIRKLETSVIRDS
jgi:hypothetical protein